MPAGVLGREKDGVVEPTFPLVGVEDDMLAGRLEREKEEEEVVASV